MLKAEEDRATREIIPQLQTSGGGRRKQTPEIRKIGAKVCPLWA